MKTLTILLLVVALVVPCIMASSVVVPPKGMSVYTAHNSPSYDGYTYIGNDFAMVMPAKHLQSLPNVNVRTYDSPQKAFQSLKTGENDAFIFPSSMGAEIINSSEEFKGIRSFELSK